MKKKVIKLVWATENLYNYLLLSLFGIFIGLHVEAFVYLLRYFHSDKYEHKLIKK